MALMQPSRWAGSRSLASVVIALSPVVRCATVAALYVEKMARNARIKAAA